MGFFDRRAIRKYSKEADKVLAYESTMAALSDDELRAKTDYFRDLLNKGKTLDDIKYEAFAVAREAAKRTIKEFPFKVQVMGSLVMHAGDVAEMKTGEGKTLTATMATYLNALSGKGSVYKMVRVSLSSIFSLLRNFDIALAVLNSPIESKPVSGPSWLYMAVLLSRMAP